MNNFQKLSLYIMTLIVFTLAASLTFAAEQRTIEGNQELNNFGEQVLSCWVTGSSAQDGFLWEFKLLGNDNWYGAIETAYNNYHWTAVRELKNENRIKYWSTNSDVESFGYKSGMLINATNIEAWRCSFLGHDDLLPVYFPMKGNLGTVVPQGEIYAYITQSADKSLRCNAMGVVPDSYTWYETTVETDSKIASTQVLPAVNVEANTKYICEIAFGGVTRRVSYTTEAPKVYNSVTVDCHDPVIKNHLQTCSVHVTDEHGQDLSTVGAFMLDSNGNQIASSITNNEGEANLVFIVNELGTFQGTIKVYREEYGERLIPVTFQVLKEKYQIRDFVFSETADFAVLTDEFYRGDDLYVSFKVWDPATSSYVKQNLQATVSLEGASKVYLSGKFNATLGTDGAFVYTVKIPLTDSYLTEAVRQNGGDTFVLAIAIDDAQMIDGGAEDNRSITILNNAPTIDAPDYVYGHENELLQFNVIISDLEMYTTSELIVDKFRMPDNARLENGKFIWTPTYLQSGTYLVTFTVTDRNGAQVSHTVVIMIDDIPEPVIARIAHPVDGDEFEFSEEIDFEAEIVSNNDNLPVTFEWDFGDGVVYTTSDLHTTHTYTASGEKDVVLTYYFLNESGKDYVTINVLPPRACNVDITAPQEFMRFYNGTDSILFEAKTDCAIPYEINWDFGDGNVAAGDAVNHIYSNPGQYVAQASITTSVNTGKDNVTVNVHDKSLCYEARDVKTFEDMESVQNDIQKDTFFRGDSVFVTFKVVDTCNGDAPVANAPIRDVYVQKQDQTGGFSNFVEFMFLDGTYYYKLESIPIIYDVSKPDYVVAIALDGDNTLTRARKPITILNYVPDVNILTPIEEQMFNENDLINLTGTAFDRETTSSRLQFTWLIDGVVVTTQQVLASTLGPGPNTVRLEVRDADGAVGFDEVIINGEGINHAPTAVIDSPIESYFNTTQYFIVSGHGEDVDGDILTETWTINNVHVSEGVKYSGDYLVGKNVIELTITDERGLTATTQTIFYVGQVITNTPPNVYIVSPLNGDAFISGESMILIAEATDLETPDQITFNWQIDNMSPFVGNIITVSTENLSIGQHIIKVNATDVQGASDVNFIGINIFPNIPFTIPAPKVDASLVLQNKTVSVIRFDGSQSYDPDSKIESDNGIRSYAWLIDGVYYDGKIIDVAFDQYKRTVSYELTVVDDDMQYATITGVFNIAEYVPPCDEECQRELRDSKIQLPIIFKQVNVPNQVYAGSYQRIYVSVFNEYTAKSGAFEDLTMRVSIPGLGVSKETTFDLGPRETKDFSFYLPIRSDALGYFPVKISVSNGNARREIYRGVTVN